MYKLSILKYIIENELFITCPFLSTRRFILYCKERAILTSREQLELFEKLRVFYPIARVKYPKVRKKVEYVNNGRRYRDLGILKDGEQWSGDLREEYASFWFKKEYALDWFKKGLLWQPSSRKFQPWETFYDEKGERKIESFYSIFQCYTLYHLIKQTTIKIKMEEWINYSKEEINKLKEKILELSKITINGCRKNKIRGEDAVVICQIISNRYFPMTQSDRRSIQFSIPSYYHNWDWYKYCSNWDAKAVLNDIGMGIDGIKKLHELVTFDTKFIDPLEKWYELITFVSVKQKKRLKGKSLLSQTLYSMEKMLRLFYEELTGNELKSPEELPNWKKNRFYGNGMTENELQYLEFLTNRYHLNPRPKLILVVEGEGEEVQFSRLAKKLFGYPFPRLGIEVMNLRGVGGFTGKKRIDKYGALEKFIDSYHAKQTIVFVILDREGRVNKIKNRLIKAPSSYYPKRTVTKDEYIHVWNKNIEFDNFSHEEIASAMTKLCESRYVFKTEEIDKCERSLYANKGNPLGNLFNDKLGYGLSKPKLLDILFESIISHPKKELTAEGKAKRCVVQVIKNVIELAARNYQPITYDIWKRYQKSGLFGNIIEQEQ